MIDSKSYSGTLFFVTIVAVIFGVLQHYDITSVFYIWEISFDIKIVSIFVYLYALYKKQKFVLNLSDLRLFPRDWFKNISFFIIPTFIYGIVVILGLTFGSLTAISLENKPTIVLGAVFDIPAIFVFSVTTVLMEEIVFRSFLLKSGLGSHSKLKTFILVNIFWSVYCTINIIDVIDTNFVITLTVFISQFIIGFYLSCVVMHYGSIWYAYSFRIGLKIISPLIVKSIVLDTDSFFTTNSLFFSAEGWVTSGIILLFALYIYLKGNKMTENHIKFREKTA